MLSTYNSFAMSRGYWEITAQMPKGGKGRWPAIWLLRAHAKVQWPPELDIAEMADGVWYGSEHGFANQDFSKAAPMLGCLCGEAHVFGLLNDGSTVAWYVDGVKMAQYPLLPGADVPYYLIVNLAINGGGWTGAEASDTVPATMHLKTIRAFALR